ASACPGGKTSSARRAAAAGARGTTSVSLGSAAAERDHGRVITARNEEALQRRAPRRCNRIVAKIGYFGIDLYFSTFTGCRDDWRIDDWRRRRCPRRVHLHSQTPQSSLPRTQRAPCTHFAFTKRRPDGDLSTGDGGLLRSSRSRT